MSKPLITRKRLAWAVGLVVAQVVILALVAAAGVVFAWVRVARTQPDLSRWHRESPRSEFVASDAKANYTFADYMKQEDKVFSELDALVKGPWAGVSAGPYCRYQAGSICDPATMLDRNWNRTFVLESKDPVGGVLLVHGLSDAPYSLRALGERLHTSGYTVIGLRVPGHGTSPKALADSTWTDWAAAVQVAMTGLRTMTPAGKPLIMVGYSNGGSLCVNYAAQALEQNAGTSSSLVRPDGLVLISPMIAITPMAEFTELYPTVAWMTGEEKLSWGNIEPEIDPFKYSSWPTNASLQANRITRHVQAEMDRLVADGRIAGFPPVLVIQSAADATVLAHGVIDTVLDKIPATPAGRAEMILFDVNRASRLDGLMGTSFEREIRPRLEPRRGSAPDGSANTLPFLLTFVTNRSPDSMDIEARAFGPGEASHTDLKMFWPMGVFSLSHVALPIPPSDRVYGLGTPEAPALLPLGTFALRGERGVLSISPGLMMRMRFNPFYDWTEDRIMTWIAQRTPGK